MKVDEFVFRRVPRDVREFADQVTLILNYGKYSSQVVTSAPQWIARNGEFTFLQSSTQNRVYFYANNQWNWLGGGANGALAAGREGDVQINSSNTFGVAAANTFNYNIGSSRLVVYRSVFLNTNTNNFMDQFTNGDPALFVVGNNDSGGTIHLIVRDSTNSRTMFEVQDTRVFIGYNRAAGVQDGNFDAYVEGKQSLFHIAGRNDQSQPGALVFEDRRNATTHTYREIGRIGSIAGTQIGTGGWMQVDPANLTNLGEETPGFDIDDCTRSIAGNISNQRFFFIQSNQVLGGSTLRNVSNCATVYIQGDTIFKIDFSGSSSVLNNYALWVDQGMVRFDGVNTGAVMELPSDATDPTGGGGAATGRIPVIIGGTTRFLAYY